MKKNLQTFFRNRLAGRLLILLIMAGLSMNYCLAGGELQNQITVTGVVTDGETNEPLPGVTIVSDLTGAGTITDIDGKFTIQVSPDDKLKFSYIGYEAITIPVNNSTVINVTLNPDVIGLDEVIVTGYGVQKKSDVTGSIASVSGEKIAEIPVSSLDQALQGRAAGVNILNNSGRPGEGATIQIRGITSVNASEPLVIIDGVPGDINTLNPNDIESTEVLKDASSAAQYGVSGGAGVIVITTKKGSSQKNSDQL